jgi:predicted  nucleic acid-binding Zn-ribbon protein
MAKIFRLKEHNQEVEFIVNQDSILNVLLKEDNDYIPRFTLKDLEIFNDIPVNQPVKYDDEIIIKAIKYGLIFLMNYKGAKDKNFAGHERVIYSLVLGRSAKGKQLLRGFHLTGWSVSKNTTVNKEWRMFRTDRVLSLTFTGSFFRLAPEGYQPNDKGMRGGIIARADFDEIRRNQEKLVKENSIQDRKDVSIEQDDEDKIATIIVEDTETVLNINEFMENPIIQQVEDLDNLRASFLKSVYGNTYLAVIGAIGRPGNIVKVKTKTGKVIGNFKVLDSATGRDLKNVKNVKGNALFDLYTFIEKRD